MSKMRNLITLTFCALFLSGCWDRTEMNDYAFWMGTALDKTKDNKLRVSAQIAIPTRIGSSVERKGGEQRGNIVISGIGRTLMDSCHSIQDKLPRRLFIGHRRAVFIDEKLAKDGIGDLLDMYSRNLDTTLRTSVFVVSGRPATEALMVNTPFNPFSGDAAVNQDKYSKIGDVALRDFFVSLESESTSPVLSAIDLNSKFNKDEKNQVFDIRQLAVFNKEGKMLGFLNKEESLSALWILDRLKMHYLTGYIPQSKRYVTLTETNLKRTITSSFEKKKLKIHVTITGNGTIRDNHTSLDLLEPANLKLIESNLSEQTEKAALHTIKKVQRLYGADIFGFGEVVHRDHPYLWRSLKPKWKRVFRTVDVTVHADLNIKRIGAQSKRI